MTNRLIFLTSGYLFLAVALCAISCKKETAVTDTQPPTITKPVTQTNTNVDTTQLAGWWYSTQPNNTNIIPIEYFGPDHTYFFDNTVNGGATVSANYNWVSADTLNIGPSQVFLIFGKKKVLKLTKDSLIFPDSKYYRVNLPLITSKSIATLAGNGLDGYPSLPNGTLTQAAAFSLSTPSDAVVDSAGNVFVCDNKDEVILKINKSGRISLFATFGPGPSPDVPPYAQNFLSPNGLAIDDIGANLYLTELAETAFVK